METIVRNGNVSLPEYAWKRLEEKAQQRKCSLWDYISESILDYEYHEPNEETKNAIEEAKNRKDYPAEDCFNDVDALFKALETAV